MEALPQEQHEQFRQAFDEVDTDGSGKIEVSELRSFLNSRWGEVLPEKVITNFIGIVDHNRDGELQFEEFVDLQMRFLPQCRGFCNECNDILLDEEPQIYKKGSESIVLCFWCYEKHAKENQRTVGEKNAGKQELKGQRSLLEWDSLGKAFSGLFIPGTSLWDAMSGVLSGSGNLDQKPEDRKCRSVPEK